MYKFNLVSSHLSGNNQFKEAVSVQSCSELGDALGEIEIPLAPDDHND